jgi:hypothetical protein
MVPMFPPRLYWLYRHDSVELQDDRKVTQSRIKLLIASCSSREFDWLHKHTYRCDCTRVHAGHDM